MVPFSSKEFLDIQANIECGFTLKPVHDMIITYSHMHHTDKYLQHSSIIWPVWQIGWVFVYELSAFGFESCCSHLNFRYGTFFEQGVPWHSGKYRVWMYSEMRLWHDNSIQSNAPYRYIQLTLYCHRISFDILNTVLLHESWKSKWKNSL